jgi:hypothetical protein
MDELLARFSAWGRLGIRRWRRAREHSSFDQRSAIVSSGRGSVRRSATGRGTVTIAFAVDDGAHLVTSIGVFCGGQDVDAAFEPESP